MARTPRGRGEGADQEVGAPQGRVPPHDLDAERSVLSSLLIETRAINEVATELRPDDFYHPAHQILFQAMLTLHDAQRPVDLITLRDHLASEKRLEAIEGEMGLAELADFEATAANVLHHARIVRDKAKKRELIRVAAEIVEEGYEDTGPADRLIDSAESKVLETSREHSRSTFRSLHDEMASTFDYIEGVLRWWLRVEAYAFLLITDEYPPFGLA